MLQNIQFKYSPILFNINCYTYFILHSETLYAYMLGDKMLHLYENCFIYIYIFFLFH